jgi:hypothetical protein
VYKGWKLKGKLQKKLLSGLSNLKPLFSFLIRAIEVLRWTEKKLDFKEI